MNGLTLLIVDDETATREGLRASLDFSRLGIDRVLEAADGREGLRVASDTNPDIILSDVRMPQMDGVKMLDRIRAFLPDCVFIFMSGFSDKEYLKAAIRLRAVSYVDKPLHFPEVEQALREAVDRCNALVEQRDAATIKEAVTATRLALRLTSPVGKDDLYEFSYLRERYGKVSGFTSAASVLLLLRDEIPLTSSFAAEAEERMKQARTGGHLHIISAEKHPGLFVFHLFQKDGLSEASVRAAAEKLAEGLPGDADYHIACGPVVSSIPKLYDSYKGAAVRLEQAYFLPSRSVCSSEKADAPRSSFDLDAAVKSVLDALEEKDAAAARAGLAALAEGLSGNTSLPSRTVQAAYFRIAGRLPELRRSLQLPPTEAAPSADALISELSACFSFDDMHRLLAEETETFFADLAGFSTESTPVYLIREYIRAHFGDPLLSTKEISDHVRLSASYACTVFKNETGKTLNQYLTEYRMERAKKYLADPRDTVANIAVRCGYNDSNYFGKAFKKCTGLSPSEYRESLIG